MKLRGFIFAIGVPAAMAAAQSTTQQQNNVPQGSLSGTVIDSVTHQPIKKARVSAFCSTPNPTALNGGQNHSVSTDATGAFLFDNNLPPGTCFVSATSQDYPQGSGMLPPKSVNITPSDKNGPVTIELIPPATVTGRILDEDGDPLPGCFAQAHPVGRPDQAIGIGNGNANGEYRITNIPAARYYISARCSTNVFQPRPFSAGPDPPPSRAYPQQFYPLAPEAKSAQVITLTPAMEKGSIDFQMKPVPVTQVRAALSLGGAPVPDPGNFNIQLVPVEQSGTFFNGPVRNTQNGAYEFPQVFPGSYYLVAFEPGRDTKGLSGYTRVDVKDRPIELVLEVKQNIGLNGVVTLDQSSASSQIQLNQVHIQLLSDFPIGIAAPNVSANADGTFSMPSVPSSRWRIFLNGPNVYMKSAFLGPADVTHDVFDFPAAAGDLRIVLGTNMGTISGTAPAGQMVFANPTDEVRGIHFGGRAAQVDATGRFSIGLVPPGKYKVTSMSPGSPISSDDPAAVEVTVKEGETVTVEIKP